MKSTTGFNNYTKEKETTMCEEEMKTIEERIIELIKAMPYNEMEIDYKDRKWTYKYGRIFTFVADRKDFPYIQYTLNGKDLPSAFGYVINQILDGKAS